MHTEQPSNERRAKLHVGEEPGGPFTYDDPDAVKSLRSGAQIILAGLSFSMTEFSDPGQYNFDIRDAIRSDLQAAGTSSKPFVFVQWEIADAAAADQDYWRGFLPPDHVCEPHTLVSDQILQPRVVLDRILAAGTEADLALVLLRENLQKLWRATGISPSDLAAEQEDMLRARLAANLNGLLADYDFWKSFCGSVHLRDLPRTIRGREWNEKRKLPPADHAVRKYQGRRLNAFILESLFGPQLLKPTEYISTRGVLDAMIEQARRERVIPEYIFLYAHEAHAPRVKWQTTEQVWGSSKETRWCPDWLLHPARVIIRGGTDRWGQQGNAQDWTDNEVNWNDYNGIEAAR